MTRKLIIALAAVALAAFGLAACGDDEGDSNGETTAEETTTTTDETTTGAGGAGGTLDVAASPSGALEYTSGPLGVDGGEVTIEFENPSSVPHDVQIEDAEGNTVGGTDVITGDSTSATVELEPGEYTYYCSVDGHRAAGMEESLTVE